MLFAPSEKCETDNFTSAIAQVGTKTVPILQRKPVHRFLKHGADSGRSFRNLWQLWIHVSGLYPKAKLLTGADRQSTIVKVLVEVVGVAVVEEDATEVAGVSLIRRG